MKKRNMVLMMAIDAALSAGGAAAPAPSDTDAVLNTLLADLKDDATLEPDANGADILDEVIEGAGIAGEANVQAAGAEVLDDALLEQVENDAARAEVYSTQSGQPELPAAFSEGDVQAAIGDAAAVVVPPKGKGGKGKGGKGKNAKPAEPKKAEGKTDAKPAEPKSPKTPRATSVTHKPGDLLLVKLGEKAADFLVFDTTHDQKAIDAARDAFIAKMNDREAIADKVKDKIQMLLVWLMKGGELNEVLKRTFTVLHKEGKLTSGDKGNLIQNLLAKPYSAGTARSQANQMFMALPELGITLKGKGEMTPNPNSALLAAINAQLGLKAKK